VPTVGSLELASDQSVVAHPSQGVAPPTQAPSRRSACGIAARRAAARGRPVSR
jgi:hypothetical protein